MNVALVAPIDAVQGKQCIKNAQKQAIASVPARTPGLKLLGVYIHTISKHSRTKQNCWTKKKTQHVGISKLVTQTPTPPQ